MIRTRNPIPPVSPLTPVPGVRTLVGGRWMHLAASGPRREASPTILLEAGLGSFSSQWSLIQPTLAAEHRVVSFDRPGLGWSTPDQRRFVARRHVRDLHQALAQIGETGPYLFVGHSLGGLIARVFADEHPVDTAGIAFLDSSHPDQLERMRSAARRYRGLGAVTVVGGLAATIWRYRAAVRHADWSRPTADAIHARRSTPSARAATTSERSAFADVLAEARTTALPPDVPITVVTAGRSMSVWHELQRDLARLTTRSRHVTVRGASHISLVTDRTDAAVVAQEIRALADRAAGEATVQPSEVH